MSLLQELKWQHVLTTSDRMKIRRLILETLFRGWTLQCRQQRLSRYKASQVLSRMIRRTKGKELIYLQVTNNNGYQVVLTKF